MPIQIHFKQFFRNALRLSLTVFLLIAFCSFGFGQEENPAASGQDGDSAAVERAQKTMGKLDKDGDGQFERNENAKAWRRLRKLDTNKDGIISLEELSKQQKPYLETGGERKLELVYKTVGQKKLALDLYYPTGEVAENDSPYPVIFYAHGGGWAAGSKHGISKGSFSKVFLALAEQGFAVASVDYRLYGKNGSVMMRDCVIDCKDAARYLSQNSDSLKLDTNRFFVMGDSAGGHIAQMLLLTSPEALPGDETLQTATYRMVAGVSWYGPCDFEKTELFNHDDRAKFRDRFGPRILGNKKNPENKLELYREMSPINYLTSDSPPLLMIQGDKDTTIPVKHAYYMKEKADSAEAPVETLIIENAGHNWRKVDAPIAPTREAIFERTVQFLVDHLEDTK